MSVLNNSIVEVYAHKPGIVDLVDGHDSINRRGDSRLSSISIKLAYVVRRMHRSSKTKELRESWGNSKGQWYIESDEW